MAAANARYSDIDLKVFFDGQCVVCAKEISIYQRRDKDGKIAFVDISSPSFNAHSEGLDPEKVQKVFHVKDADNNLYTGVDGFVKIWEVLGIFAPLAYLAKSPLSRPIFDLGYIAFMKVRPYLPRKDCPDGTCKI